MRGKGVRRGKWQNAYRITPAYAGKSRVSVQYETCHRDHPRLCGEKACILQRHLQTKGSPPPMRGKAIFARYFSARSGITPAYAGKRKICQYPRSLFQDHPRLCGEKATRQPQKVKKIGSPPPMRGKGPLAYRSSRRFRITPAYAGKSPINCNEFIIFQDHPRLCGEKHFDTLFRFSVTGSPPPMRGKVMV